MSPAITALLQANPQRCLATLGSPDTALMGTGNYIFIFHRFIELLSRAKLCVGFMRNTHMNVIVLHSEKLLRNGGRGVVEVERDQLHIQVVQ